MKVAIAFLVLVVSLHAGEAIKCLTCPGITKCKLDDTQEKMCSGSCMKVTQEGKEMSTRSCSPVKAQDGCSMQSRVNVKIETCACNTDLCNGGPNLSPPTVLGVTLLLVAIRGLFN